MMNKGDEMNTQPPVNWRKPDASTEAIERDALYALKIGTEYLELLTSRNLLVAGSSILELGPGHNYGSVLVLACRGASVAVADRFPVPWDGDYHPKFYEALKAKMDALHPKYVTDPITRCINAAGTGDVVKVVESPAEHLEGLADESIDIVLSNAVLEHAEDPARVARELYRITRSGGAGVHQVDFRDHRDFSRPLEYLLLGVDAFEAMFAERHGECGRQIRHYEMRSLFEAVGFSVTGFDANWIAQDDYLDDFLPRLRASQSVYRNAPRNELRTISGRFFLNKTANN
jgi:SAM-dependent methyltransferase